MGDNNDNFDLQALMHALATSQISSTENTTQAINQLGAVVESYIQRQPASRRGTSGPRPKEPKPYDGDRSNGQLDDHIRDLRNWIAFHEKRDHWTDEDEKVQQASTYLTGKIHRMFTLQAQNIHTFPEYITWLQATFRDNNEQIRLRDEWQRTIQGGRAVMDYASDLVYLAARILPQKSTEEIKDHFRTGLNARIQMNMAEHPEWDTLDLNEYITRADRQDQIELAKEQVRKRVGTTSHGQSYAITDAPRRGGRVPSTLTRRPRKGTDEWQAYCRQHSACFNCGEPGHNSRDCPQSRVTLPHSEPLGPRRRPGAIPPRKKTPFRSGKART